ncbi:MAG: NTP transferase domain-containing protein [Alphaproteobacteria bacterium]|nr:NTP transferase domain-containing protein [Alphaproteobacteria bacterium]
MRQAVVLVGGLGARLGPRTSATPKPLMPMGNGRVFLDYGLAHLISQGISEILLLAGHLGEQVMARYDGWTFGRCRIAVIREPQPAGTAGALRLAAGRLDDIFVMTNGDSLFECAIPPLHRALRPDDRGALALRWVPDAARFGTVELQHGRVSNFEEKGAKSGPGLVNGGVYVLRREIVDRIGPAPCSMEYEVFPALARAGRLAGAVCEDYFIDIGVPETLAEAEQTLPNRPLAAAVRRMFESASPPFNKTGATQA